MFDRVYETKAVAALRQPRQHQRQKDCIGGIVGEMDLGIVSLLRSLRQRKKRDRQLCRRHRGLSSAGIRSSWAKLTLSGKSSVGGIVGSGSEDTSSSAGSGCTVTDCRSLVVVEDCDQFSGAISGRDLGVFRGNYFVSDATRHRTAAVHPVRPSRWTTPPSVRSTAVPEDFLSFYAALLSATAERSKRCALTTATFLISPSSPV